MFSVRIIRAIALSLALVWLPMSAFAQLCATHSMATKIGGTGHPALPQNADELLQAHGLDASFTKLAVVDAEMFWHSVDNYDEPCQATTMCALTNAVLVTESSAFLSPGISQALVSRESVFPHSYERAPATPPPRNAL
jgi:hypothetical protein